MSDKAVYNRAQLDEHYYLRSFVSNYKQLIDIKSLKEDKVKYLNRLKNIGKLVDDIDFNQNLLFLYDRNISKEVFLRGMSHMENLCSFYLCSMTECYDIFWGNRTKDNIVQSDDNIMYTIHDINQDIACVYVDIDMFSRASDRIVTSLISDRDARVNHKGTPLYSWVFFRGTYEELRTTKGFSDILKLFLDKKDSGYSIYDLSASSSKVVNEKPPIKSSSGENKVEKSDKLSDIY